MIVTDHYDFDYGFVVENCRLVVDTRNATAGMDNPRCQIVKAEPPDAAANEPTTTLTLTSPCRHNRGVI